MYKCLHHYIVHLKLLCYVNYISVKFKEAKGKDRSSKFKMTIILKAINYGYLYSAILVSNYPLYWIRNLFMVEF